MNTSNDVTDFEEFQFGWWIFVCLIPVQILIAFISLNKLGSLPIDTNVFVSINMILVLPYFLFYGLTTKISQEAIIVSFGIGLIEKRIPLNRVTTVEKVRNPWYYGLGLRVIPNGILYNIGGSDAVELRFNDTTRIFRIGTKDSTSLKHEILSRLK